MTSVSTTTHINMGRGLSVLHHCHHKRGASSWRLSGHSDDNIVYFTGTVEELLAFGEAIQHAAGAYLQSCKARAEEEVDA